METSSTISTIKLVGYLSAFGFFEYLNVPSLQFTILTVLMIIDFASGIGKQYVLNPSGITSHRAWIGVIKKISTLMIALVLGLMFLGLGIDSKIYIKGVISILIMAETYSIIQNIYTIRTGKILPEYDVISTLLKTVGEMIKEMIEKSLKPKK